jgi:hypothetical protein
MPNCNDLLAGLDPACDALNKAGGVNKRVWVGSKENITATVDNAGYVNSISMKNVGSIPSRLFRFFGKRDKNFATWALTAGENINTFNHTAVLELFYANPTQLLAIQSLVNADDVVVIMQGNDDKIIVLGLENGLNGSAGEGGTGTLLNDSTSYKVTLSGEQRIMPQYFSINGTVATIAQNIAYLDAISSSL